MGNSEVSSAKPTATGKWLVPTVTVLVCLVVVGIIISRRMWVYKNIHQPLQERADRMAADLKAKGVTVGEPKLLEGTKDFDQAIEIVVDGSPIRLVEFDLLQETQAKELRHIHEHHPTKVLGTDQPAEDEGPIVIIGFDKHPAKSKLLEAFHK